MEETDLSEQLKERCRQLDEAGTISFECEQNIFTVISRLSRSREILDEMKTFDQDEINTVSSFIEQALIKSAQILIQLHGIED